MNPNGEDRILEEIEAINELSNQQTVADINYRLQFYNIADGANKDIFNKAREKGII